MKSPSNWINLQDYLGVNQEAGQEMAGKVAGQVGAQASAAQHQLKTDQEKFDQQAAAGSNQYTPGDGSDAAAHAQQGYTGPSSLGDVDPNLQAQVSDAATRVKNAGTQSGQETELGQAYQGKTASGGLDSFLLSGGVGGGAMAELQSKYGTLGQGTYDAAQNASVKTGAAVKQAATENQAKWGAKATADQTAKDAEAADRARQLPDPPYEQRNNPQFYAQKYGTDPKAEKQKFDQFQKAVHYTAGDMAENTATDLDFFNSAWAEATGGKNDPIYDQGQKFHSNTISHDTNNPDGVGGGNSSGGLGKHIWWTVDDYPVFRQMDAAQWKELQGLSKHFQDRWIAAKRAQLAPSWGKNNVKLTGGQDF